MRGAVSLAAALALPLTTAAGGPFPERGLIVFLALAVILFTLVVPGPVPASPDRPPPDQHGGAFILVARRYALRFEMPFAPTANSSSTSKLTGSDHLAIGPGGVS